MINILLLNIKCLIVDIIIMIWYIINALYILISTQVDK